MGLMHCNLHYAEVDEDFRPMSRDLFIMEFGRAAAMEFDRYQADRTALIGQDQWDALLAARKLYASMDLDNSGKIDRAEFLAHYPDDFDLFDLSDLDQSNSLDLEEFMTLDSTIRLFRIHDPDALGGIRKANWSLGRGLSFDVYDMNDDGLVTVANFVYIEALRRGFKLLADGSKTVTKEHWLKHHEKSEGRLTKTRIEQLKHSFKRHDVDNDGVINEEDWVRFSRCPDLPLRLRQKQLSQVDEFIQSTLKELSQVDEMVNIWGGGSVHAEEDFLRDVSTQLRRILVPPPVLTDGSRGPSAAERRKMAKSMHAQQQVSSKALRVAAEATSLARMHRRVAAIAIGLAYIYLFENAIAILSTHTNYNVEPSDCKARLQNKLGMTTVLWICSLLAMMLLFFLRVLCKCGGSGPSEGENGRAGRDADSESEMKEDPDVDVHEPLSPKTFEGRLAQTRVQMNPMHEEELKEDEDESRAAAFDIDGEPNGAFVDVSPRPKGTTLEMVQAYGGDENGGHMHTEYVASI